ncbi:hypothetical protein FJTKL_07154 [Diaporthe vaccinii]|uniref:Uncharacterized protein n=1 Tax=Diaporthe vaccinii TaxID=105482 RepID=A0ABR4EVD5_9PEZI
MARLGHTTADLGNRLGPPLNRFIYLLKSAATAVDSQACGPLCLVLSLFGPVHPFFARTHPPSSPLARLQACTYTRTLCRVILAGASCKSFLESQPAPRQGTAVEKSCRDPLSISTLSPSHPPPEIHSLVDICPFCWLPSRPGRNPVSAVRSAGTSTASFCGLRRAVKGVSLSESCRNGATRAPQG